MTVLAGDLLGHRHALILGLMRQHRAFDHIADGIDAGQVGAPVVVGGDLAALSHFDAKRIEPQPL